jgi:hypothetical protein
MLALEDNMMQVNPWEKAADCERALRLTIDPVHRDKLKDIRPGTLTGPCKDDLTVAYAHWLDR